MVVYMISGIGIDTRRDTSLRRGNPILQADSIHRLREERNMLYWALVFLVVALIAGVFGFTGVAIAAAGIAKILFVVFLILFLVSIVTHLARGATR
jgi:uncharacterized membrane protein YtjA (UPF0391 family)